MPGTDQALVSVIMPYFNGSYYMEQAIQSILDQTYDNIEIIVVDDASPNDGESAFIEHLSQKHKFKLITHTTNKGIPPTLADAAEASNGEFIAELSQDDLYKPEKIERQMAELLDKNLDAVYAIGDILYEGSDELVVRDTEKLNKIIDSGNALKILKQKNLSGISIQGLLAKRSVYQKDIIPIWRDFLLDDWPVNIRLFERYNVGFMDHPLWTNRAHSKSTSRNVWKWLGPQIEVIARMTPEHTRAEGIGNRLASLARRLLKQNNEPNTIIRLAAAGLMLTESPDKQKKASRILNKLPSKQKKNIIIDKLKLINEVIECKNKPLIPDKSGNIDWKNIGKKIAHATNAKSDNERLHSISNLLYSLSFNSQSGKKASDHMHTNLLLASLLLTNATDDESKIICAIKSLHPKFNDLINEKCRLLKEKSGRSFRNLW